MKDQWENNLLCAIVCSQCEGKLPPNQKRILSVYDHQPICLACKQVEESKSDYAEISKQMIGNRYYCSELDWAGYKAVGGPDIDQNPGWSWTYFGAVAPTEIADDGNTYYVGAL